MWPRDNHDDPTLDAAAVDAAGMNFLRKMRHGEEEAVPVAVLLNHSERVRA